MKQYAAFDVSLKVAQGCVVAEDGRVLVEGRVTAEPEAMAMWLGRHAPSLARAGIETGPLATWHLQGLLGLGVPPPRACCVGSLRESDQWPPGH